MQPQAVQTPMRTAQVEFTGKSGEFFKLWIVNVLLSILTLGIYSAWAKVRTNQYMHGHTSLENHSFRYLATPWQILKGRIIAVVLLVIFSVASSLNPLAAVAISLLLIVATPWLIIQGLRFSMRMTAYRNVRFSFDGSYGGVIVNFILLPLLGALTLYLAMPWVFQRMDKFIHDNISYGGKKFRLNTETGTYYLAAVAAIGTVIAAIVIISVTAGVSAFTAFQNGGLSGDNASPAAFFAFAGLYLGIFIASFLARAIYQSIILNHVMRSLTLEDVASFNSDIRPAGYVWLTMSNTLLIILSFGLAYPVTRIRKNRFLANAISVNLTAEADNLVNTVTGQDAAFGEEAAGLFDADLSFT
ncbi:YjgN family protein [Pelagibaculum spongiae]|uniref:DUF898 domain-containing protein n=1 Tax=Pelagibaculum spongiae TaxID=2080658 RepID=A0A2V1GP21_9GAMM|nr:YjgN family protein [Pelagibaculum spongiae]PVZ63912.1 DUF898 domain-containing protein [Pelagibaculum spongiae]